MKALMISLYNKVMLAMYARKQGAWMAVHTELEAFISAGCIGEPTPEMWNDHKLARSWGPMPKSGSCYHSPNFSYPV